MCSLKTNMQGERVGVNWPHTIYYAWPKAKQMTEGANENYCSKQRGEVRNQDFHSSEAGGRCL